MKMEQARSLHILYITQNLDYLYYIVPIERPEISDIKALKDILFSTYEALDRIDKSFDSTLTLFCHHPFASKHIKELRAPFIVACRSRKL